MAFYYGYIKENINLSASGGAAQAFSIWAINNGYVIYGVSYSSDFKKAEYKRIDKITDIKELCGTKYLYPDTKSVVENIIEDIKQKKKVLLFGLPCFIAFAINAIDKAGCHNEDLITIDLICHGPMITQVHSQYIELLEKTYKSTLVSLNVRDKSCGWNNPHIKGIFFNKKIYNKSFYSSLYSKCFALGTMPGCFNCKHKGDNRLSDITIGDHWGIDDNAIGFSSQGNSIIITHTEKGDQILKLIDGLMIYYETDDALLRKHNPYYYSPVKKSDNHDIFQNAFKKYGIIKAVSKTLSFKSKVKLLLKGKKAL